MTDQKADELERLKFSLAAVESEVRRLKRLMALTAFMAAFALVAALFPRLAGLIGLAVVVCGIGVAVILYVAAIGWGLDSMTRSHQPHAEPRGTTLIHRRGAESNVRSHCLAAPQREARCSTRHSNSCAIWNSALPAGARLNVGACGRISV